MKGFFYFEPMRIPPSLQEGDKVAIVATAKRMEVDYQPALATLRAWGLEPILGKYPLEFNGYFAGTDEQKIEDLQWALDSEEIKAIIFIRGGYGTTKILDRINLNKSPTATVCSGKASPGPGHSNEYVAVQSGEFLSQHPLAWVKLLKSLQTMDRRWTP